MPLLLLPRFEVGAELGQRYGGDRVRRGEPLERGDRGRPVTGRRVRSGGGHGLAGRALDCRETRLEIVERARHERMAWCERLEPCQRVRMRSRLELARGVLDDSRCLPIQGVLLRLGIQRGLDLPLSAPCLGMVGRQREHGVDGGPCGGQVAAGERLRGVLQSASDLTLALSLCFGRCLSGPRLLEQCVEALHRGKHVLEVVEDHEGIDELAIRDGRARQLDLPRCPPCLRLPAPLGLLLRLAPPRLCLGLALLDVGQLRPQTSQEAGDQFVRRTEALERFDGLAVAAGRERLLLFLDGGGRGRILRFPLPPLLEGAQRLPRQLVRFGVRRILDEDFARGTDRRLEAAVREAVPRPRQRRLDQPARVGFFLSLAPEIAD